MINVRMINDQLWIKLQRSFQGKEALDKFFDEIIKVIPEITIKNV